MVRAFHINTGVFNPYILYYRDLIKFCSAEYHPKRKKLKGYQKCRKKR
jgi:hypothetical protein